MSGQKLATSSLHNLLSDKSSLINDPTNTDSDATTDNSISGWSSSSDAFGITATVNHNDTLSAQQMHNDYRPTLLSVGATSGSSTLHYATVANGVTTGSSLTAGSTTNWVASLTNTDIANDIKADVAGGTITYNEMLTLLNTVDANGAVTSSEFSDLKTIAANLNNGITTSSYVTNIADKLILGDAANAHWNGGSNTAVALGNLAVGTNTTQLSELIGKWFLGTDLPGMGSLQGIADPHYVMNTAPLYGSTGAPSASDINQGYLGDCYFLASLAEVATLEPSTIQSMIQSDGNGSYGVRFFINGQADWVTVNCALPESSGIVYTNNMLFNQTTTDLWANLVEKAYAELNSSGVLPRAAGNSYDLISGGWADPITELTNKAVTYYNVSSSVSAQNTLKQTMITALSQNNEVWLGSFNAEYDSNGYLTFDSSHAYSVIGYDSKTGNLIFRNPWGTMTGQYWDTTFEATMAQLYAVSATIAVATGAPTASTLAAISESPASADLNAGKVVTLTLTVSSAVTVTGAPTLTLNDGGTATYTSGSGTNTLTFTYTVLAGQNTSALAITGINLPNGATINNASGIATNLSLTGLTQTGPQIDTTAPTAPTISGDSVNTNVVTLNGKAEANSIVTVFDGSTKLGTATTNSSGAWSYTTGVLANGTNVFTATATDQAGNVSAASSTLSQVINVAPKVSSIAISGTSIVNGNGDLGAGRVVTITLAMSESVLVTGTPALTLNDGGVATYKSGSGTNSLTFNYTVGSGQNTLALAVTGVSMPSGASIKDAAGNTAVLSAANVTFAGMQIDTLAPNAPTISGDSITGNVVTLNGKAEANSLITVYDNALKLGTATTNSSGNWSYTTGALANGTNGFTATAMDQAGNTGALSSVFSQAINYSPPKVSAVSVSGSGIVSGKGDLGAGKVVTITLSMSSSVLVTGSPTLALNDGGVATYAGGSGTNTLTFNYTIGAGQNTSALAVSGVNTPSGSSIKDSFGNLATLLGANVTFSGLQVNTFVPNAPVISSTKLVSGAAILTGTAEANSIVTIYNNKMAYGTVQANSSGNWSFTSGVTQGTVNTFTATSVDQAGNKSGTSGTTFLALCNGNVVSLPNEVDTLIGVGNTNYFYVYNSADTVIQASSSNNTYNWLIPTVNYTLPTNVDSLLLEGNATQGAGNNDSINYLYDFSGVASTLIAGNGTDSLFVGTANGTTLVGGAGADTFGFLYTPIGKDTVTNFHTSNGVLEFNTTLFANYAAAMSHAQQVGANTVFTIDSNDTVTVQNVAKTSLTANNFRFV
jgi:hypothetical protein